MPLEAIAPERARVESRAPKSGGMVDRATTNMYSIARRRTRGSCEWSKEMVQWTSSLGFLPRQPVHCKWQDGFLWCMANGATDGFP